MFDTLNVIQSYSNDTMTDYIEIGGETYFCENELHKLFKPELKMEIIELHAKENGFNRDDFIKFINEYCDENVIENIVRNQLIQEGKLQSIMYNLQMWYRFI